MNLTFLNTLLVIAALNTLLVIAAYRTFAQTSLAFITLWLLGACAQANDFSEQANRSPEPISSTSRDDFGRSAYPIWSPLSFFENQTIAERHNAKAGDPDALLALYIMASGRHNLDDYRIIQQQVTQFVNSIKKQTNGLLDPWQQGEILNRAMHHHFFRSAISAKKIHSNVSSNNQSSNQHSSNQQSPNNTTPPNNYALDQSTLTGIFKNHQFNCISSSLLYAVLTRHLGLNAEGVMLPSHAFIQLHFEEGKIAEVETTSPNGYDQHHNAEFYERAANQWFNPRGLAPSTYNDYLERELIALWQLGTRNMLHQHTHPQNMDTIDRGRLAEISAFIDPTYEAAQINRMHYYTTEALTLVEQKQWPSLVRFFEQVMDHLAIDTENFNHNESLQNSFFWLNLIAIDAYAQTQQLDPTLHYIRQSINLAHNDERLAQAKNKTLEALNTLIKYFVSQQSFNEGLYTISALAHYTSDDPLFALRVNEFYTLWAKYYWEQKQWSNAAATLEDYLTQPYLTNDLKDTHNNLSNAYYNWVISELNNQSIASAKAIIEHCGVLHYGLTVCNKAKNAIGKYRHTQETQTKSRNTDKLDNLGLL